jgi:hypothetical protein
MALVWAEGKKERAISIIPMVATEVGFIAG